MKKLLVLLLPFVLLSCSNDEVGKGKNENTRQYTGSAAAPVPPDKSKFTREVTALTSSFGNGKDVWMFEYYLISPVDSAKSYANMGKWFRFYEDGTYENGRWSEEWAGGSWFLREGSEYGNILLLDNRDDSQDMEWELQGLSAEQDNWSWVGTKRFGLNNNFAKVTRLYSIPTREQFGFTRD